MITLSTSILLLLIACCTVKNQGKDNVKEDRTVSSEKMEVVKKLYDEYKNGEIFECKYEGQTVYNAGMNLYDAGRVIYDEKGNEIGGCNYAYNNVDSICEKQTDCEVIYRVKNNIWRDSAVDKYELGK